MRHDYRMSEMDLGGGAAPVLRGHFLYNQPMRKHVSWRAGGVAQRVYIPADLEDLTWMVRSVFCARGHPHGRAGQQPLGA
jgi:UDP-N-acetylmuramate dehydrogenase